MRKSLSRVKKKTDARRPTFSSLFHFIRLWNMWTVELPLTHLFFLYAARPDGQDSTHKYKDDKTVHSISYMQETFDYRVNCLTICLYIQIILNTNNTVYSYYTRQWQACDRGICRCHIEDDCCQCYRHIKRTSNSHLRLHDTSAELIYSHVTVFISTVCRFSLFWRQAFIQRKRLKYN